MKKNGDAKEPVSISMPITLVNHLSRYCFKKDLPVSTVVCKAIKRYLASEAIDENCSLLDKLYQTDDE